jgi:hypothetical protein
MKGALLVTVASVSRLFVLSLCLALPAAAFAQRQKSTVPDLEAEGHKGDMARAAQKKANERFDKADEDKDGLITKEEALKQLPYVGENFDKFDKSKDGKLTWEEYIGHDKWKRESSK